MGRRRQHMEGERNEGTNNMMEPTSTGYCQTDKGRLTAGPFYAGGNLKADTVDPIGEVKVHVLCAHWSQCTCF